MCITGPQSRSVTSVTTIEVEPTLASASASCSQPIHAPLYSATMSTSATAKVKVIARLRPSGRGEQPDPGVRICHNEPSNSSFTIVNSSGNTSISDSTSTTLFTGVAVVNPRDPTQMFRYPFSSCYGPEATQESIFETDVLPLLDVAWSGITVTIFAYGVTSSGKTHTMQGTEEAPGVIPRVVNTLFDRASSSATRSEIAVSYIEIYKDDVYDLLVERENAPKLPVRENDAGQVFVAGLLSTSISSTAEFDSLYSTATKRRSVGATLLNRASSRSHSVLTLYLRAQEGDRIREGKINLVDLAGSENNKLTGNDASRMAESSAINKSLSVLGQVVHALNTGASRVPYRNAKLTRILQDALGGSSVGLLICNLAPGTKFRQDTLNTLKTKNIENKPVVHEKATVPPPIIPPPAVLAVKPVLGNRQGTRPSLVPRPASRVSSYGLGNHRTSNFGLDAGKENLLGKVVAKVKEKTPGLSEAEIDARISRAVEAEVARRVAESRQQWEEERAREREKERAEREAERERVEKTKEAGPSRKRRHEFDDDGNVDQMIRRHHDLDDQLQARLAELERKFERGNPEAMTGAMSPVSKKKTGRAYVALARMHQDKGNLQVALDLYKRAETYVPDNVKLKERWILFLVHVFLCRAAASSTAPASKSRASGLQEQRLGPVERAPIIEVEWAVKHDKPFKPSPKRNKNKKARRAQTPVEMEIDPGHHILSDDQMEVDAIATSLVGRAPTERTNIVHEDQPMETPAKKPKRTVIDKAKAVLHEEENTEDNTAPRKTSRLAV
ncbi:unnamed protein product [Mycena citricolor]|uniref:Kinesin-like protein n=1 Tax=Mycena citricolor TaxID=2018698 RepID=A0AAD2GRM5_9AGAR|nr:unnamed protein product [Mycena citricolor]